jgi:hypothetical protein
MYCEPWSCRSFNPRATAAANPPKWRRTPWRIGSNASKRVARAWAKLAKVPADRLRSVGMPDGLN